MLHLPFHEDKPSIPKAQLDCQFVSGICSQKQRMDAFDNFLEIVNSFSNWSIYFSIRLFPLTFKFIIHRRYLLFKPKCEDPQNLIFSNYTCGSNQFQKTHQIFLRLSSIGCRSFLHDCSMLKVLICWWSWVVGNGDFQKVWNMWNVREFNIR